MSEVHASDKSLSPPPPSRGRRLFGAVLTIVVIGVVFLGVLPQFANYEEVMGTVRSLSVREGLVLAALSLWFLAAYWLVLMVVLPSLRFGEAAVNHSTGTAVTNSVPAGGALALGFNYSMYLSWGFTPHAVTAGILTAGVFDNFVKWGLPIVAYALVALTSGTAGVGWAVPTIGLALLIAAVATLAAVLRSDRLATRVGRALTRLSAPVLRRLRRPSFDMVQRTLFLRHNLVRLLRKRWPMLTLAMSANHLAMFLVLLASLRFVGVDEGRLGLLTALAGFSVARLLSAVPITPGGIGVVDAGYVAILSLGLESADRPALVAGVLLFRALTFFPPIPFGLGAWLFWRSNRSWRKDWREVRRGEVLEAPDSS